MDLSISFLYCSVMIGLRTFLKDWSNFDHDLPFDALYERQRELVRCDLLPFRKGRGPGSGVPLTPETLSTFLIGLLATDSLSDLGNRTAEMCEARPKVSDKKGWKVKGRRTFKSDVAHALSGSRLADWSKPGADLNESCFFGVQVTRPWRGILIRSQEFGKQAAEGIQGIEYFVNEEARLSAPCLSRSVSIEMEPFWFICERLRAALRGEI